jgi:hypothetical protein
MRQPETSWIVHKHTCDHGQKSSMACYAVRKATIDQLTGIGMRPTPGRKRLLASSKQVLWSSEVNIEMWQSVVPADEPVALLVRLHTAVSRLCKPANTCRNNTSSKRGTSCVLYMQRPGPAHLGQQGAKLIQLLLQWRHLLLLLPQCFPAGPVPLGCVCGLSARVAVGNSCAVPGKG